jgi:hypothetical protein
VKVPINAQVIDGKVVISRKTGTDGPIGGICHKNATKPRHTEWAWVDPRGISPALAFCLVSLTRKRFASNGSGHAINGCSRSISDKPVMRQLAEDIHPNSSMSALA